MEIWLKSNSVPFLWNCDCSPPPLLPQAIIKVNQPGNGLGRIGFFVPKSLWLGGFYRIKNKFIQISSLSRVIICIVTFRVLLKIDMEIRRGEGGSIN